MADEWTPEPHPFEWLTEAYVHCPDEEPCTLAQELFDKGLIYMANTVLHVYGYALGVSIDERRRVTGLNLHKTGDPDGIWFDEELTVIGRQKMEKAGLR